MSLHPPQGDPMVAELNEDYDPAALVPSERAKYATNLWRYRRPFALPHFALALRGLREGDDNPFPALAHFLEREPMLRGLRHLPKCLEWIGLLLGRFNRKLEREEARRTTVGAFLESRVPPGERPSWEAAFQGFAAAWNNNWPFVERFGCLEVPKVYAAVVMGRDTPLSFSLPGEADEGICPMALIQHLNAEHNAVCFAVDERMLTGRRTSKLHADKRGGARAAVSASF
jgi:hypothetical protein